MNATLTRCLADELQRPPPPAVAACGAFLRQHFGPATVAVVFAGSGLRTSDADAVLGFYLIVYDLRTALPQFFARLGVRLVAPPGGLKIIGPQRPIIVRPGKGVDAAHNSVRPMGQLAGADRNGDKNCHATTCVNFVPGRNCVCHPCCPWFSG